MKISNTSLLLWIILGGHCIYANIVSWNLDEAIITVTGKRDSTRAFRDKLSDHVPLASPVKLTSTDTLKIILTATENGVPKRPHQAFLLLRDQDTGLEISFPFLMKENGKGKVITSQDDLPIQFKISSQPLRATILLGSFGSSQAFGNHVFNLNIELDPRAAIPKYTKPLRYGKREEIHHIFKPEPKSGPLIVSLFFVVAVTASLPALLIWWIYLGANLSHLPNALRKAPVAHLLFFTSILGIEVVLFLYYYHWSLFRVLPVAGLISLVTLFSGPKALSEVQSRRLAGER